MVKKKEVWIRCHFPHLTAALSVLNKVSVLRQCLGGLPRPQVGGEPLRPAGGAVGVRRWRRVLGGAGPGALPAPGHGAMGGIGRAVQAIGEPSLHLS